MENFYLIAARMLPACCPSLCLFGADLLGLLHVSVNVCRHQNSSQPTVRQNFGEFGSDHAFPSGEQGHVQMHVPGGCLFLFAAQYAMAGLPDFVQMWMQPQCCMKSNQRGFLVTMR